MKHNPALKLILLWLLAVGAGCGQKGPLFIPEKEIVAEEINNSDRFPDGDGKEETTPQEDEIRK